MNTECTLSNEELIEKCNEWVSRLAKSGGKDWTLHVPVSFNTDPDMLFCELAKRFKDTLTQQPAAHTATAWVERKIEIYGEPKKTDNYIYKDKWGSFGECVYAYPPSTINESWCAKQPVSWLEQVQLPIQGYSLEQAKIIWSEGVKYGEGVEDDLLPFYDVIKSLTNEQPTTDTD